MDALEPTSEIFEEEVVSCSLSRERGGGGIKMIFLNSAFECVRGGQSVLKTLLMSCRKIGKRRKKKKMFVKFYRKCPKTDMLTHKF